MYKMMFSLQNNNNGALTSDKAMPQKDSTSDNTSTFARNRNNYMSGFFTQTTQEAQQKKWMNGNRDASSIIHKKRVNTIGNGTLNANGEQMSFTSSEETNSVRNARMRTRNGGSIVPSKKTHRMAHL